MGKINSFSDVNKIYKLFKEKNLNSTDMFNIKNIKSQCKLNKRRRRAAQYEERHFGYMYRRRGKRALFENRTFEITFKNFYGNYNTEIKLCRCCKFIDITLKKSYMTLLTLHIICEDLDVINRSLEIMSVPDEDILNCIGLFAHFFLMLVLSW